MRSANAGFALTNQARGLQVVAALSMIINKINTCTEQKLFRLFQMLKNQGCFEVDTLVVLKNMHTWLTWNR